MHTITREEAAQRSQTIDLETIDVTLDLTGAAGEGTTFTSVSELTFTTRVPETFLDVIADSVDSVEVNGAAAQYEFDGGRVTLTNLPVGVELTVRVEAQCKYSTTGEGLHRYRDPEDGATYLYTQYEPTDARRVYACFDQLDLKARWQFTIAADTDWVVLSNQPQVSETTQGAFTTRVFDRTPPLSSYITAVIAGPYTRVDGGVWRGGAADSQPVDVPLALYCRAALAPYLDSDEVLAVTRAGLDFYHARYNYTYPWGKYDQVFVPEYNLGAMENPGCVTFNENYISRDRTTRSERQSRANTIFHEMCHMWFGDLVTPRWWDDLWLKESFADNQGSAGLVAATPYKGEWATFAAGRKEWAYYQDQLSTTHPIAASIPDVDAAKHNFDGITYAKGAAVLKQLVAYVGESAFYAGASDLFKRHAFSSASLNDLLEVLEAHSERSDLKDWAHRWLQTTGPSRLSCSREDRLLSITQAGEVMRPHTIRVGFFKGEDAVRVDQVEVTIRQQTYELDLSEKQMSADFILLNDDDLTYAVIELHGPDLAYAVDHVHRMAHPTSRAVVWSALWAAMLTQKLPPARYIEAVGRHAESETEDAVLEDVINQAVKALRYFTPGIHRDERAAWFAQRALENCANETERDRQHIWATAAVQALTLDRSNRPEQNRFLEDLANQNSSLITVGPSLAWRARVALAARGRFTQTQVDAARQEDNTGEGRVWALRTGAAIPERKSRLNAWDMVLADKLTNQEMSAVLAGLAVGGIGNQVPGFAGGFFDEVGPYWMEHSIGMGNRFVAGAFPDLIDASNPADAQALLYQVSYWLSESDAPAALRRLMEEKRDDLRQRFEVQQAWLE